VPLAVTDMIPSLQTGLIDALDAPPLAALINQWFGLAPNMIDLKWAPLIGGVVVNKKVWEKVPPDLRAKMIVAARKAGRQYSGEIRKLGDGAIPAMQKRGLNIVKVDSAAMAELRSEVEKLYPTLRIRMGGPELFDAVLKLRNEYRSRKSR
jgi:TRAP-type C4-dicarboxylate transport system substrate-binding protein